MSAFTPAPWIAIPQTDGSSILAHEYETTNQMKPKGFRIIAHLLARLNSIKEDEANARLILAAPDLLEVLKDAYPYVKDDALRTKMGALIVKAEDSS